MRNGFCSRSPRKNSLPKTFPLAIRLLIKPPPAHRQLISFLGKAAMVDHRLTVLPLCQFRSPVSPIGGLISTFGQSFPGFRQHSLDHRWAQTTGQTTNSGSCILWQFGFLYFIFINLFFYLFFTSNHHWNIIIGDRSLALALIGGLPTIFGHRNTSHNHRSPPSMAGFAGDLEDKSQVCYAGPKIFLCSSHRRWWWW